MSDSKVLRHDPLSDAEQILREKYYGRPASADTTRPAVEFANATGSERKKRASKEKPTHYKVVCISMYMKDIESLENKVAELKRRGYTKANKSQLIRYALNQLDINNLPTPYDPLEDNNNSSQS